MSNSLLITIILAVLILAVMVGLWASSRRAKPIVGGIGWILIPVGLYLLGITDLAVNGVMSIVEWAQRTRWDTLMTTGAALAGGGVLLAIVAGFLPGARKAPPASQPAQRPVGGAQARPQVGARPAPGAPQPAPATRAQSKPAAGGKDGLTDEDREIAELLKKRGIM